VRAAVTPRAIVAYGLAIVPAPVVSLPRDRSTNTPVAAGAM
jgi:hypothetical protein